MAMHNPPHPGEFIIQVYLDPNNLSGCEVAENPVWLLQRCIASLRSGRADEKIVRT